MRQRGNGTMCHNPRRTRRIGVTYAIVVMTRRGSCVKLNADYTLARSRLACPPPLPAPCSTTTSSLLLLLLVPLHLVYSFFFVCPAARFHINDSIAVLGRAATRATSGEDVLRNRWPLSNIFLPASLAPIVRIRSRAHSSLALRARARVLAGTYVPG